jgi:hypothetical protein
MARCQAEAEIPALAKVSLAVPSPSFPLVQIPELPIPTVTPTAIGPEVALPPLPTEEKPERWCLYYSARCGPDPTLATSEGVCSFKYFCDREGEYGPGDDRGGTVIRVCCFDTKEECDFVSKKANALDGDTLTFIQQGCKVKWWRIICVDECYRIVRDECIKCFAKPRRTERIVVFGPFGTEDDCKSYHVNLCNLLGLEGEAESREEGPAAQPTEGEAPQSTNGRVDYNLFAEAPSREELCPLF